MRQIRDTHADGAFLDSVSVPNALGPDQFSPPLPALVRGRLGLPVIANAGSWVTTRDRTDYSGADGVMIEDFATGLAPADWALDLDRALGLVRKGRVVIAQSYPAAGDVDARLFDLASYLLIKGGRTYVNLEVASSPEWFPEYGVELGPAQAPPPQRVEQLAQQGVYARRYGHGLAVVNPGDTPATYRPDRTYRRVAPVGGGVVPPDGVPPASWRLTLKPVRGAIELGPRRAAILLDPA